jgi:hypothetical protein
MVAKNVEKDPIIQDKPDMAGGSVKNASAGRVKSAGSAGPNFTSDKDLKAGFPAPDSPYGKG